VQRGANNRREGRGASWMASGKKPRCWQVIYFSASSLIEGETRKGVEDVLMNRGEEGAGEAGRGGRRLLLQKNNTKEKIKRKKL